MEDKLQELWDKESNDYQEVSQRMAPGLKSDVSYT